MPEVVFSVCCSINIVTPNPTLRYETENGIFAQEHAVVGSKLADEAGTQSNGFYQYIGDDDRIYRVDYTVGKQGYKPKVITTTSHFNHRDNNIHIPSIQSSPSSTIERRIRRAQALRQSRTLQSGNIRNHRNPLAQLLPTSPHGKRRRRQRPFEHQHLRRRRQRRTLCSRFEWNKSG